MADIETKNVRGDELDPRLGYDMLRLYLLHNACHIVVTGTMSMDY